MVFCEIFCLAWTFSLTYVLCLVCSSADRDLGICVPKHGSRKTIRPLQQNDTIELLNNSSSGLWLIEQYLASQPPTAAANILEASSPTADTEDGPKIAPTATEPDIRPHQSSSSPKNEVNKNVSKSIDTPPVDTKSGCSNKRRSNGNV
jgi:hypothetical protein